MKGKFMNENLKRASNLLTGDRIGITSQTEGVINKYLTDALGEFFLLNGYAKIKINVVKNGFEIVVLANAKGIKQLKVLP